MLIANISHDLKTPITSIKGYIDGINDGVADTPEKLSRYLNTIKSKADMIDDLVSNLSTFAKLEVSGLTFNTEQGDLRDLLLDVLDSYRIDLEQCGIELSIEISPTPLTVRIDGDKMRRVLTNIIDNSIKYRLPESKLLDVKCFADSGSAYIIIKDDGMGIAAGELTRVFDSFYRADSSRTSQIKGNGLGLGIAKQITEKNGGRLWLRSDGINKGTTVTLNLPLD
jgi:histidine kinase